MAGKHVSAARPSMTTPATKSTVPQHRQNARTFQGTPLTMQGVTRDAIGAASLLGSSIPKGPAAPALAAAHAGKAYNLTTSEALAQQDISTVLANVDAISKSRALRAVARNAEGVAPTATPLGIEAARLLANGRGPRVTVMGMVAGDIARAVSEFNRYGYTVNRAMVPPRMDPMTKFSYWQMEQPTILGELPQGSRDNLAAAFERGVTVWTSVSDIGTSPTNAARSGVSY